MDPFEVPDPGFLVDEAPTEEVPTLELDIDFEADTMEIQDPTYAGC